MKIIDVAVSQLGVKETELNNIKYNKWYYNRQISGGSYPYCAVFISWCAEQVGLSTKIIPKTASVRTMHDFFVSEKRFIDKSSIPNVGDIMICRNNASHVGLIESIDTNGIWVIEGMSGNGIVRTYYAYTNPIITGYGKPNYPDEIVKSADVPILKAKLSSKRLMTATSNTTSTSLKKTMTAEQIYDYFRFRGYSAEAAAGILASIQVTSGYSSSYKPITTPTSGGMGLFNWNWDNVTSVSGDMSKDRVSYPNSRLAKYLAWCDNNGYEYESAGSQLEYFWNEDKTNRHWSAQLANIGSWEPGDVNNIGTPEDTGAIFGCYYTSHDTSDGNYTKERNSAKSLYSKYKDRAVLTENPVQSSTNVPKVIGNSGETTAATSNMRTGDMKFQTTAGSYTYITHVVKDGETLDSIAFNYNVTPQMIFFANNLEQWEVTAGQSLKVPQVQGMLTREEQIEGVEELVSLTHTSSVEVSHPTVEVEFYGEYGKLAVTSTLNPISRSHFEQDIINVTTKRDMSQDCPTFMIQLVWRNEWYKKLSSNDMLIIYMWRPPEEKHIVMYGLIDDIRRNTDWSGLQPKRTLQITGRGFNKALCQFDIGILENFSGLFGSQGFFSSLTTMQGVSSAGAIELVLNAYINKGLKYKFGNDKTILDYLSKDFTPYPEERLFELTSFTSFFGTMWNFIKQLGNSPWNETFWEIKDDKPCIVHRPTPFTKAYWTNINRLLVKDSDLVSNNTGRSDLETYTVYQSNQHFLGQSTINVFPPVWYPPYYPKYGLRLLSRNTVYETSNGGYNSRAYTIDLFNFYIKNNIFENGQISVKGSNKYKVGERVILESTGIEYYIESVSHTFTIYESWVTTLSVTRGIHPSERFTPPYGAAEDLTPTIMFAIINLTKDGKVDWTNLQKYEISKSPTTTNRGVTTTGNGTTYDFRGVTFTFPIEGLDFSTVQNNGYITSPFGWRVHPIYGTEKFHSGIDIAFENCEGAKILAAADGTVYMAGAAQGYGNYIGLDHGNGIMTGYAHMYDGHLYVKVGDKVTAGQHIADIGSAGGSTGAHLHFEVLIDNEVVDPVTAFATVKQTGYSNIDSTSSRSEVVQSVYQYLTSTMGLSKSAACAVMGNIQQESNFNLSAENSSSGAFGLCQWLGDRRDSLISYCHSQGLEVLSVAGQMGYLNSELHGSESSALSTLHGVDDSETGVYNAALSFGEAFERYNSATETGLRGDYAVNFYKSI